MGKNEQVWKPLLGTHDLGKPFFTPHSLSLQPENIMETVSGKEEAMYQPCMETSLNESIHDEGQILS